MAEKEKGPRDLTKRPPSRSANAPDHLRLGKHGVRTNLLTDQERREAAHAQAVSEEYEEGRNTGAGPNPYKIKSVRESLTKKALDKIANEDLGPGVTDARRASYLESQRESNASDAELAIPGETLTNTGQKIVLEPDRLAADEKAVLPRAGTPYEEATKEAGKDDLTADKNTGPGAPEVER